MRFGTDSIAALVLHLQSRSGQPHPGQIRPALVEYTIRAFRRSVIVYSLAGPHLLSRRRGPTPAAVARRLRAPQRLEAGARSRPPPCPLRVCGRGLAPGAAE